MNRGTRALVRVATETSETFCLPAETNGIIARSFLPMSSIGCFLPASRSSR